MAEISNRFKLAAIDLDGTLLGPDHAISDANAHAVRRLQATGAQVVLASGRHFNSMRKYVAALPGVQWVVSCQGGEVSDSNRTTILSRQFLPAAAVEKTLEAGHALGFSTVAYMVEGVFTDSTSDFEMDFYAGLAGHRPVVLERGELLARDIFKVIWMGEAADLSRVVLTDVVSLSGPVPCVPNAAFFGVHAGGCFKRFFFGHAGFASWDSAFNSGGVWRRGKRYSDVRVGRSLGGDAAGLATGACQGKIGRARWPRRDRTGTRRGFSALG